MALRLEYNAPMTFPRTVPGLKALTILVGAYGVIWIALEGNLARVTLLAIGVTLVAVGNVLTRFLGGRTMPLLLGLAVAAALGALSGFTSAMLTLLLMVVKTGLHAHGPEFTPEQINWVLAQLPWWTTAGLLAGVGMGLVRAAISRQESTDR